MSIKAFCENHMKLMKRKTFNAFGWIALNLLALGLFSLVIMEEAGWALSSIGLGFMLIWALGNYSYHEIKRYKSK